MIKTRIMSLNNAFADRSVVDNFNLFFFQDHCALVRSGCAFMVHVCEDEHQLYTHFFSVQSPKLQ